MASSAHVVRGLASYLEHFNMHGCGYTGGASSWVVGAAAAGTGLLQLAGNSELPPAALTAPASSHANSPACMQSWLVANSEVLQQAVASGWASLSVAQLAGLAQHARQEEAQQRQQEGGPPLYQPTEQPQKKSRRDDQQQRQSSSDESGAATAARLSGGSGGGSTNHSTLAAGRIVGRAAQAPGCSQTPGSSSAGFCSLSSAEQQRIRDQCGCIPAYQHLAAWQVAVKPFNPGQLQALCVTYLRCNFTSSECLVPAVRSQQLIPMLQQLHKQAKAEQQRLLRPGQPTAAAVPETATAIKLLCALRLLQHWDIVCPTQPGMPEPLRKMLEQEGYAAADSGEDSDDDDGVQVLDTEPAADFADDVEAQLQQLEDGDCDMVLVKYVPGRHEQPDVQLVSC
jgi:hypothetical protein